MSELVIIDSGGANISSIQFALERLGSSAVLTNDASRVRAADRVILPGVGSAQIAMHQLSKAGLDTLIPTLTQPILGICLGMQLLYQASEEGPTRCLGVLNGVATRLSTGGKLAVPHMGWNEFEPIGKSPLLRGIKRRHHAFFIHSYVLPLGSDTVATCEYGQPFTAVVTRGNFHGTQFHPERSGEIGAQLLANFLRL